MGKQNRPGKCTAADSPIAFRRIGEAADPGLAQRPVAGYRAPYIPHPIKLQRIGKDSNLGLGGYSPPTSFPTGGRLVVEPKAHARLLHGDDRLTLQAFAESVRLWTWQEAPLTGEWLMADFLERCTWSPRRTCAWPSSKSRLYYWQPLVARASTSWLIGSQARLRNPLELHAISITVPRRQPKACRAPKANRFRRTGAGGEGSIPVPNYSTCARGLCPGTAVIPKA